MTTWIRVHESFGPGLRCGSSVITAEVLSTWPRDEVQRMAVQMTGIEIPASVWPPEPEPPLFTTVDEMMAAVLDLLSRRREDADQ